MVSIHGDSRSLIYDAVILPKESEEGMIASFPILLSMPGPGEILVIVLIIIVIFGPSKLPEIGKYIGLGVKEFKKAMRNIVSDDDDKKKSDSNDIDGNNKKA
jgi:sec-independent protein translocase protein TatA